MRFKDLLLENGLFEEAKKCSNIINSGEYRNTKLLLVRGEATLKTDSCVVKNIRKDRVPLDTDPLIDELVEAYRVRFYPDRLSRRESKYAVAAADIDQSDISAQHVSSYGRAYIVFPEADAQINSYPSDTYTIFQFIDSHVRNFGNFSRKLDSEETNEFVWQLFDNRYSTLYDFSKAMYHDDISRVKDIINDKLNILIDQLDEAQSNKVLKEKGSFSMVGFFESLQSAFDKLDKYFSRADSEIGKKDKEVIFGGDKYVAIAHKFFTRFFKYYPETDSYKIKPENEIVWS